MFSRFRIRPSRTSSVLAVIVGVGILIIGLTQVGRAGGVFMVLWVGVLVLIIGYHLANALGRPVPWLLEVEARPASTDGQSPTVGAALRELEAVRGEGLISEAEYAAKRAEIMDRPW